MLNPSSWLMLSLQRDLLPRPRISSRDEAEAGKLNVTFLCRKESKHGLNAHPRHSEDWFTLDSIIQMYDSVMCDSCLK